MLFILSPSLTRWSYGKKFSFEFGTLLVTNELYAFFNLEAMQPRYQSFSPTLLPPHIAPSVASSLIGEQVIHIFVFTKMTTQCTNTAPACPQINELSAPVQDIEE